MKIYAKRGVAFVIDFIVFIFFVGVALLLCFVPFFKINPDPLFGVLFFPLINMRDFTFKGASIGKKIVGIRVYDRNWRKPKYSVLFRRACFTLSRCLQKYQDYPAVYEEGPITALRVIKEEYNKFGTRVVDKRIFKKFSKEAKLREGRWEDNMSILYDEYIEYKYNRKFYAE